VERKKVRGDSRGALLERTRRGKKETRTRVSEDPPNPRKTKTSSPISWLTGWPTPPKIRAVARK